MLESDVSYAFLMSYSAASQNLNSLCSSMQFLPFVCFLYYYLVNPTNSLNQQEVIC
jgi:hypothetical protein